MSRLILTAAACLFLISLSMANELGTHETIRYPKEPRVKTMAYSPDGSQLAISFSQRLGRSSRGVDFINVSACKKTATHKRDAPFSMAYSIDNKIICMISESRQVRIDAITAAELPSRSVTSQAAAKPGDIGITLEERNGKLLIKSIDDGSPAQSSGKINVRDEVVGFADGRHSSYAKAIGMSAANVRKRLAGDAGKQLRLKVLPKGKFDEAEAEEIVLTRSEKIWNGKAWLFKEPASVTTEENVLKCMRGGYHEIVSAKTGQTIAKLQTVDVENRTHMTLSQDQKRCACRAKRKDGDGYAVEVFDIASQERIAFIPCVEESFYNLDFDATGEFVLAGTRQTVEVGSIKEQRFVGFLTLGWKPTAEDLAKEKKSREEFDDIMNSRTAAGAVKAEVMLETGYRPFNAKRAKHPLVRSKAVSSKNVLAAIASHGETRLFDVKSGNLLAKIPTNKVEGVGLDTTGRVDLKFSPDGNWLSLYLENVLHIVDVSKVKPEPNPKKAYGFIPY